MMRIAIPKCAHCGNEHPKYWHEPAEILTCADCAEGREALRDVLDYTKERFKEDPPRRPTAQKERDACIEQIQRMIDQASNCGNPKCSNVIRHSQGVLNGMKKGLPTALNKSLVIAIALLVSGSAAYGEEPRAQPFLIDSANAVRLPSNWQTIKVVPCVASTTIAKPVGAVKRNRIERAYDWAKAKKDNHPKIWRGTTFGFHCAVGTLQVVATLMGMKR